MFSNEFLISWTWFVLLAVFVPLVALLSGVAGVFLHLQIEFKITINDHINSEEKGGRRRTTEEEMSL